MKFRQILKIVNIRVQVVTLSPFFLGTLLALYQGSSFSVVTAILMFLSSFCLGMATTALNTYKDFVKGLDTRASSLEEEKVLVHENLPPESAFKVALALFALGGILGLVLSLAIAWALAPLGLFCMVLAIRYSSGKPPVSYTPFGEILVGLSQGILLFCISYFVQAKEFNSLVLLNSLPSGVFVALILTVNNTCDLEGDKFAGRKTLSIVLGPQKSRLLIIAMILSGYALCLGLSLKRSPSLWPHLPLVLALLYSLFLYRKMNQRKYSAQSKGPNMGSILHIFLLFTGAQALSFSLPLMLFTV